MIYVQHQRSMIGPSGLSAIRKDLLDSCFLMRLQSPITCRKTTACQTCRVGLTKSADLTRLLDLRRDRSATHVPSSCLLGLIEHSLAFMVLTLL